MHRVVDRHPRRHRPAWRIDVQVNIRPGIVELQEQHLGHDQIRTVVIDYALQKDNAVFEQPAVYIEDALFAAGAFHHVGNHGHDGTPGMPGAAE